MFFEVISHIFNFDLAWLIQFVMDNLLWGFFFACIAHFIFAKGPILGTAFVGLYIFATFDFVTALGWVFRSGFFWAPLIGLIALTGYDSFFSNPQKAPIGRGVFAAVVFYAGLAAINGFM